jgi:hypothetical protein
MGLRRLRRKGQQGPGGRRLWQASLWRRCRRGGGRRGGSRGGAVRGGTLPNGLLPDGGVPNGMIPVGKRRNEAAQAIDRASHVYHLAVTV